MKKIILVLACLLIVVSAVAQDTIRYTTISLNMRKDANASSSIVATLPQGTSVAVAKDCDCQWILISYKGKSGYVASKYLSHNQPAQYHHSSSHHSYTNSEGVKVQSPTHYKSAPAGATALCRDGTYSFSQHRRGTCSHHGGVSRWL